MKERVRREPTPRTQYSAKTKPRQHNFVFPSVTGPFILGPRPLGNKSRVIWETHSDLLKHFLFGCLFSSFNHVANVSLISNTDQTHTVCDKAKKTNRNSPSLANLAYFLYHFTSSHSANFNKIYCF